MSLWHVSDAQSNGLIRRGPAIIVPWLWAKLIVDSETSKSSTSVPRRGNLFSQSTIHLFTQSSCPCHISSLTHPRDGKYQRTVEGYLKKQGFLSVPLCRDVVLKSSWLHNLGTSTRYHFNRAYPWKCIGSPWEVMKFILQSDFCDRIFSVSFFWAY